MTTQIDPPRFEYGKPLLIAGLREQVTTIASIPDQWRRAMAIIIPNRVGHVGYGICFNCLGCGESFDYLAGGEVSSLSGLPSQLSGVSIPAQQYAIFSHPEHVSKLSSTIGTISNNWLPKSGYEIGHPGPGMPDFFERYGEEFDPQTGMGGIEVWVPIKA